MFEDGEDREREGKVFVSQVEVECCIRTWLANWINGGYMISTDQSRAEQIEVRRRRFNSFFYDMVQHARSAIMPNTYMHAIASLPFPHTLGIISYHIISHHDPAPRSSKRPELSISFLYVQVPYPLPISHHRGATE